MQKNLLKAPSIALSNIIFNKEVTHNNVCFVGSLCLKSRLKLLNNMNMLRSNALDGRGELRFHKINYFSWTYKLITHNSSTRSKLVINDLSY